MEGQMKGESKNTWIDKRDDNRLIHSAESIKYHWEVLKAKSCAIYIAEHYKISFN